MYTYILELFLNNLNIKNNYQIIFEIIYLF